MPDSCECEFPDWDDSEKDHLLCKNCGYDEYTGGQTWAFNVGYVVVR